MVGAGVWCGVDRQRLLWVGRCPKGEHLCLGYIACSRGTWPDRHLDRPLRHRAPPNVHAYAVLLFVGTPLLLGSLWGLFGVVLFIPLLAARVRGEETMLLDGLPGYRDYCAKVRFRLLPSVW